MTIGTKIRILRQERNMTQNELAEAIGLAGITIQQYEADKYKPKIQQIEKLAAALNVSPAQISTSDYWVNPDGNTTTQILNLDEDLSYRAYKKQMKKNLDFVLAAIRKKDFQSDLLVEIGMRFLSMNPAGQEQVHRHISDLAELPKYQKNQQEDLPQTDGQETPVDNQ